MIAGKIETCTAFSQRIDSRLLIRLFLAISTLYGFWVVFNMDEYLPWRVRFVRAVEMTALAHFGPWLATLGIRGRWRFLVAAILLPSVVAVSFLWWTFDLLAAIAGAGCMTWILLQVIRGKRLGN